jgi:hypothetical protein
MSLLLVAEAVADIKKHPPTDLPLQMAVLAVVLAVKMGFTP